MSKLISRPKLDLSAFCDPYTRRYALATPFIQGEFVYATDGRILVQTTRELCEASEPTGKVPNGCATIVEPLDKVRDWDFPPPIVACEKCKGCGATFGICDVCNGLGYLVNGTNEFVPCGECDGTTTWIERCEWCFAEYKNSIYGQWYMNHVRLLPNVRVGAISNSHEAPLYFRFDGGCGCLMPLQKSARADAEAKRAHG